MNICFDYMYVCKRKLILKNTVIIKKYLKFYILPLHSVLSLNVKREAKSKTKFDYIFKQTN